MGAGLQNRWIMTALGLCAGLALYALGELINNDVLHDRAGLGLVVMTLAFFTALLAMAGPVGLRPALVPSALIGGVTAVLLVWASTRFAAVSESLNTGLPIMAGWVLTLIPIPFAIAMRRDGWRDYPTLFTESWDLVVRYAAALIFVGIVWAVILLSDTLLKIVGLTVIADLIEIDAAPFAITGAALGLAMAVVTELEEMISPDLFLRLLRLLLPVVLVVMAVFLLALPFRGMSGLFGDLSAAVTLMVMLGLAATLVTTAIAQGDAEAAASGLLRLSARFMALIMPVFAALAVWAVAQRVGQYGWTPDRVTAALIAALGLGYGVVYGLSAALGGAWMARIRQGNIRMALLLLLACVVILTPALNPQSLSASSQLARLEAGKVAPADFDFYTLAQWGVAGTAAQDALRERAAQPGNEALAAAINRPPAATDAAAELDALVSGVEVLPAPRADEGRALLAALSPADRAGLVQHCTVPDIEGTPTCVLAFADLWPEAQGDEAVVIAVWPNGETGVHGFARDGDGWRRVEWHLSGPEAPGPSPFGKRVTPAQAQAMIAALRAGIPAPRPAPLNRLRLDDLDLILLP